MAVSDWDSRARPSPKSDNTRGVTSCSCDVALAHRGIKRAGELNPRVNKMSEGEVRTWVLYMRFSAMSEDRKRRIAENTVLIIY
jgi:hypothetical protein